MNTLEEKQRLFFSVFTELVPDSEAFVHLHPQGRQFFILTVADEEIRQKALRVLIRINKFANEHDYNYHTPVYSWVCLPSEYTSTYNTIMSTNLPTCKECHNE